MSDAAYKVNPWHLAGHLEILRRILARRSVEIRGTYEALFWGRAYSRQYEALEAFLRGEQ